MTAFDLVFVIVFFSVLGMLAAAALAALRRQPSKALGRLRTLGLFLASYLLVVALTSVISPRKSVPIGEARCFDDWCVSVKGIERSPADGGSSYNVALELHSRARARAQRENGVSVYVLDERGRRYEPSPDSSAVPLDTMLSPGASVIATRRFYLPSDVREAGLVVAHGWFPGLFIIGDDQSLLHKPTVTPLPRN